MARIETYPFDLAPTVNDYVIGTDGDSLNATKNYKVMTFLDYLGTQYNLNSTDMLFEYDDVISTAVGNGYVSTNNYADGTILMSGVTNIYVSKITGFGQLVEDALNSLGTNGLTIIFADMGNRNNYGIFDVTSAADVDANTINLTVTATTTLGSISAGKSMGIRIGLGGGGGASISDTVYGVGWNGDTTNGASKNALYDQINAMPTLAGTNVFTGNNQFSGALATTFDQGIFVGDGTNDTIGNRIQFTNVTNPAALVSASYPSLSFSGDDLVIQTSGADPEYFTKFATSNTAARTHTLQDQSGTLAHLSDLASSFSEAELTSYTTTGATAEVASTITVPIDTLATDGDVLEFSYNFQSTGSTNSNNLTVNVNFASNGHSLNGLTAVTGSVYYTLKGSIQRITSTTYTIECTFGHGIDGAGLPYQVVVFSDTIGTGNLTTTAYDIVIRMTDSANSDTFKLVSGWIKQASIG